MRRQRILATHRSRHNRGCWGRTGFQQHGGGAGRADTSEVFRPILASPRWPLPNEMLQVKISLPLLLDATWAAVTADNFWHFWSVGLL